MIASEKVQELLEAATPSIIEGLKEEVKRSIIWQVKDDAAKLVSEQVQTWVKENILPEVVKQLVESKEGLMQISAQLAPKLAETMVTSLAESFKENMESSYKRRDMFTKMFD